MLHHHVKAIGLFLESTFVLIRALLSFWKNLCNRERIIFW